ncbi:MAG: tetratricopeptide repeat protein, partial [Anaerolineae bacterium]|nr:tetratricopeptide repeat protein [Anaerolineae bacterium]
MTTISLHKYHDQINHLLEDSQFSLAANHCRYILQQHPRHVDTYRLLARTLIEQGDFSGATELFLRVLSADPNDYIAHAGLSVVYREEDVLSQAIWHLERAYEIEPYNGAIQQELKALYIDFSETKARKQQGEPKMVVPDDLPLTKGALARLYIRGEFYAQAIDILREALVEDEDRIDLEVLLAEALWRDHQRKAAVQVCLQVLDKLPNCITANAVLAEIWLQIGRIEEAQDYLVELQALTLMDMATQDLESPAGSAFKPDGAIALPAVMEVERMGEDMQSLADAEAMGTVASDSQFTAEDDDEYQWLEGLGDEYAADESAVISEEPAVVMTDSDWLRRELAADDEETAVADEIASWLDESTELDMEEEDSGIHTLGAMAAGAAAAGVIGSQLKDDDDSFDWLAAESIEEDALEDDAPIFTSIASAEEAEEMPDWLSDMAGEDLEPVQVSPAEAIIRIDDDEFDDFSEADDEEANIYDWLDDTVLDKPVAELEPGELDLSQFAEFDNKEEDDEEIVWRLTDELNPIDETEAEQEDTPDNFDFEISPAETGELEDVPDWLMGSSGTDELEAATISDKASNEIADELAEWVAANQPEADDDDNDEMPDWLSGESEVPGTAVLGANVAEAMEMEAEDNDFFTDDLPDWMIDSSANIDDATLVDSAPLISEDIVESESSPLAEADMPDWLTGNVMDADDSGFLETDNLSTESNAEPETTGDLPDWLLGGTGGFSDQDDVEPQVVDEALPDWFSGEQSSDDEEETDEDDGRSATAVVGGLLGAVAAGAFAKELFDDEEEDEDVMEDAVSDEQDNLIAPQDEPEEPGNLLPEESDEFDWLDDLDGASYSAENISSPTSDLGDGLDWMDLDDTDDSGELNLDALLGLEPEEEAPLEIETEEEPVLAGLAEDESLDWLDALAGGEPEPVDEMPTWKWSEDSEEEPTLISEEDVDLPDLLEVVDSDIDEPVETAVVEDLDDAMSWLEDLAAEPDAPVEELPSIAEDMDLDAFFAAGPDEAFLDDLSRESEQLETLDEIFAADTQNDSWLEGLSDSDEEPMPDFLADDAAFDLDDELVLETAVAESDPQTTDDIGEPPEDLDDAMAWLEQLAARQGAPLDELPSVDAGQEPEDDGLGVAEVAASAAALGALDALFADDDEEESEVELVTEMPSLDSEDDLLALDVPEDPDEAMAWLEQLAARQGAPLDELPSVSEYDDIPAFPEVDDDLFGFDEAETELDELMADGDTLPQFSDTGDALDELDDAMAWLDGLEDEAQPESVEVEAASAGITDDLSDELDWLEFVTSSDEETAVYNADELSVSDDDLADALDTLTLLAVAGAAVVSVGADEEEVEVVEIETAVIEPEAAHIPDDTFIEEMPEDPDEAMAWLEKLAARQGAPLDELPYVDEGEYDGLVAAGAAMAVEAEAESILEEPDLLPEDFIDDLPELDEP